LREQAVSALGQKDLVAEFDRLVHLAALDQVCVRFKDRVKLSDVGTCSPPRTRRRA
jgi:hypothetical protein